MEYRKYMHIERWGGPAVSGIEYGKALVFPKIDGTNSVLYLDENGELRAGSRNRDLSVDNDNAGFYKQMLESEEGKNIHNFLLEHPHHLIYGEFLVPHTLKTYRDNAWRKFYVFDVYDGLNERYVPYYLYSSYLEIWGIEYIPPLGEVLNGKEEDFVKFLEKNTYLIKDGEGVGEGIVIKNYEFLNKFGHNCFAKMVRSEFKEKHIKTMGVSRFERGGVEVKIVEEFLTETFVSKEYAKLLVSKNGEWDPKMIPELLGRIWHEFITEEIWNILSKLKNPTIDFKVLNKLVVEKVKGSLPEVFGLTIDRSSEGVAR